MHPIINSLWVEKYRPQTLDEYIGNSDLKIKINDYIQDNDIPHLLLHSTAGTGKTSVAKIIINSIKCDSLYINASDENSIEIIRNKIKSFASSMGFSPLKIIILDEADFLTQNAMAALRNIMETYSKSCRFILTCNYVEKISEPIQSRCVVFNIIPPDKKQIAIKLSSILKLEGIEKFDRVDIKTIIDKTYPDIRSAINMMQSSITNSELKLSKFTLIELNWMNEVLAVLKQPASPKDKFKNIRQIIADSKVRSFNDFYTFLYMHVDEFSKNNISNIILAIAKYQYQDAFCVDKEINVMALITEILTES